MSGSIRVVLDGDWTPIDPLSISILQIMGDFFNEQQAELDADIEAAANEARDELRRTSPFRRGSGRGHYRSGWADVIRKEGEHDWWYAGAGTWACVFNKNKPTLGHLLEYGHDIKRGDSVVGHARAFPHIEHARQTAANYLKRKGWIR